MTIGDDVRRAGAIAWKDLLSERRAKAGTGAIVALAAVMLVLFGFALGPDADVLQDAGAGVFWLTVLLSGVLAFNRSYQVELEGGALETLLLYPGARWPVFVGKLVANLALLLLVEAVSVPLAIVLLRLSIGGAALPLVAVVLLGTFGFATLGTFYAAMASRVRVREVLLPLLLFPMLVPLLVASVQATRALLTGNAMGDAGAWIRLVAAFDVLFFAAAMLTFEYVIEA